MAQRQDSHGLPRTACPRTPGTAAHDGPRTGPPPPSAHWSPAPLGTTDATIIAIAGRLNITTIATLDTRHFNAVRPNHVQTFRLVAEQT